MTNLTFVEEKKIKYIQFSILSPQEIRRLSVVEIENDLTFENNAPKIGGLMDPRLGAVDKDIYCTTDLNSFIECPGYFGHLELSKPVFHESFMNFILLILRCIDHTTSKLILNYNSQKIKNILKIRNPRQRLGMLSKLCSTVNSLKKEKNNSTSDFFHVNVNYQPKYSRDGWCILAKFEKSITSEPTRIITAERIHEIFVNMSDEDCISLGLNPKLSRPDWMILTVLPIPPPTIRPSVMFDTTSRAEDDLTYKLGDIIRTNKTLFQLSISCAPIQIINETLNLLQYHIGSYMNNKIPNIAKSMQKSGRPIKSLAQRLQGKEGRVRGNLMGKRVDFSARTVITPDPNIFLDEIGVPWSIALNLTYPEIVNDLNIDNLKKLINNGPIHHPGAKYVIRNDGSRLDLRFVKKLSDLHLETGYQVERHLQDGDVVLFNRQPSLHKMSMMGHRVKIMHFSTFRMNLSATSPYNADFDGDEMNLHLPQTIESKTELLHLLMLPSCIISQQGNKPIIGIVQDSLVGAFLLSQRDTFLNSTEFMASVMQLKEWDGFFPAPSILKPKILWTGKQIFSLFLPKVNFLRKCLSHSENEKSNISPGDTRVLILGGKLISGMIDKRSVGASGGGLIHICWKEYGSKKTNYFLSQFQFVVNSWLQSRGFSVGIGDTLADKKTKIEVNKTIKKAKQEAREVAQKNIFKKDETYLGITLNETFENQINKILNNARDKAGSNAQKSLLNSNNIKRMVICGSKGSFINISQIIACVGQQNVDGKRIPLGFKNRSLPHFSINNIGPETRGFVQNSYIAGLKPAEFFFHAMGGREGLIDTAIKTSETGYIQRRLSKAMENIMIEYDLTVRNNEGNLIQFFYGEDAMDALFLENQLFNTAKLSDRELEIVYRLDNNSPCFGLDSKGKFYEKFINQKKDKTTLEIIKQEFIQIKNDREILREMILQNYDLNIPLPVNIDRIIRKAQSEFFENPIDNLITPREIIDGVKKIETFCFNSIGQETKIICSKNCACCKCENKLNATFLFRIHLRSILASKLVIIKYRLSKKAFVWVSNEICNQYRKSIANPGEMVGTISAQSIGQPATQMTLNTFHYAGVSAKNVTLGVPRLKEIINVLQAVKTPSLTIYFRKEYRTIIKKIKQFQQTLEHVILKNLIKKIFFSYDPDPFKTIFKKERSIVESFFEIPDPNFDVSLLGTWLLTLKLQKEEFVEKKLSCEQLIEKIKKKIKPLSLLIINSNENCKNLYVRIKIFWPNIQKIKKTQEKIENTNKICPIYEKQYLKRLNHFMSNFNLKNKGSAKIKKAFIRKIDSPFLNIKDGSLDYQKEYILDTEGVDLRYILNYNGIDHTKSFSNDILEIFKILGIEAARRILILELRNLISFDGSYVNSRHLFLLVDIMTHRGKLMSITRHGINKTEVGPITKCSFEETIEILYQAAAFGVCDNLKGISAGILVGQLPFLGTGKIDLYLAEKKLLE
jgi:DNA-directed RNA polymerase II subunit RPB1